MRIEGQSLEKLFQVMWEHPELVDNFLKDPDAFIHSLGLSLNEIERRLLFSIDKITLKAYMEQGYDNRISKCLWTWYYRKFLSSSVIHAIPNVCYGGAAVHQLMLSDMIRNLYFKRAIAKRVTPNSVVADVGTGTGLLAIYASKAGAKKVFAIEKDDRILKIASEIIKENQVNNISLINGDCSEIILPNKVDIIISECLGALGINSNFIPSVIKFKENNLKEGGYIIPQKVSLFIVPYETIFYEMWINFAKRDILGVSIMSLDKYLKNQVFTIIGEVKGFLCEPKEFWALNLKEYKSDTIHINKQIEFTASRGGILHGFLGWFKAYLVDNVILDTSPSSPRTHWYQVFFPLKKRLRIKKGAKIQLEIQAKIDKNTIYWKWVVNIDGIIFEHNTLDSYPLYSPKRQQKRGAFND